ncbi:MULTISPECIES: helix-hairpin-helix domain-containing protein [Facklamia]|uniref:ComEA protein n=2 Tax=Facklamia hominis TaxID=178214 RepID=K1LAE0_9LACT|nr:MULTISPECIES: helix-hairpin-helix domain-containing protein [Facklamia]EKB53445.1 comEA protein [Facklamia hominis CCUG 36813]MDK7188009.1 helix-hairpin-helix domain-containing protein [Facklamia hominis]OFL68488.1 comEA protein [Facklamia sp. HMSC062C11]PKY92643.1 comEA protein [Facklamia hominis]RYC97600.1 comEA protein [Facklamia hominis]
MNYFQEDLKDKKHWFFPSLAVFLLLMIGLIVFRILHPSSSSSFEEVLLQERSELESLVTTDETEMLESTKSDQIYVDLKGEVVKEGVYVLDRGARLFDLIEMAGGFTEQAAKDSLNLALLLEDQSVVKVYSLAEWDLLQSEESKQSDLALSGLFGDYPSSSLQNSDQESVVNINQADQTELETLPNIGPKKAQEIIQYRENNGSFQSIEAIQNVSGIGPKTYESLKDLITVGF